VVTARMKPYAAVPVVGLLAVVSTAALPGPRVDPVPVEAPAPAPAAVTTSVPPPSPTTVPPLEVGDATASVVRKGDQLEVTLSTDVLFDFSSAALAPSARDSLTALAPRIARSASPGIVAIVGHTDSVGGEALNQALSEARAQAVRAVLAAARPDLRFHVSGRGATQPVAPNEIAGRDNPEGRARNRRVEVTFAAPE
jgi:OOP family OmpA-OmpF porin